MLAGAFRIGGQQPCAGVSENRLIACHSELEWTGLSHSRSENRGG